jgi:hypothetical protein
MYLRQTPWPSYVSVVTLPSHFNVSLQSCHFVTFFISQLSPYTMNALLLQHTTSNTSPSLFNPRRTTSPPRPILCAPPSLLVVRCFTSSAPSFDMSLFDSMTSLFRNVPRYGTSLPFQRHASAQSLSPLSEQVECVFISGHFGACIGETCTPLYSILYLRRCIVLPSCFHACALDHVTAFVSTTFPSALTLSNAGEVSMVSFPFWLSVGVVSTSGGGVSSSSGDKVDKYCFRAERKR